jgi:hypothetical protein
VDDTVALRVRRWCAVVLIAIAGAEAIVLALLAAGLESRTRLGPFLIVLHSPDKPLWTGLGTAFGLVVLGWSSAVYRRVGFLMIATMVALAVAIAARMAPDVVTKSDIAVTELYVQLATAGNLLVGPYSRFLWHHPGPLYFWLQIPFYALSGETGGGLYAGALAINLISLGVLAWVLLRVDRGALAVGILGAWLLFAWRDRFILASPWTAHVQVPSTITFVVLAAAAASGRPWMLPLLMVFGSFMAQCHVALVPLVGALSAGAMITVVVTRRFHGVRLSPVFNVCAWLLLALWLLPIVEQLSHKPGNLLQLWRFFTTGKEATPSYGAAFSAWSYAIVGVLRPDLYLPYGGHFRFTHLVWGVPLAIAQVLALVVIGVRAFRGGRRFEASMAWTALAAAVISLWSVMHIHDDILDHEVYWIVPLGAVNLAIIGAAMVRALHRGLPRWTAAPHTAVISCAVIVLLCVHDGFGDFKRLVAFEYAPRGKDVQIDTAYQSVRRYLGAEEISKPLFRVEQWDIAAAVFSRLYGSGTPFAIEDRWLPMFTDAFTAHGDEDAVITIGGRPQEDEQGGVVTLQRDPIYVSAERLKR